MRGIKRSPMTNLLLYIQFLEDVLNSWGKRSPMASMFSVSENMITLRKGEGNLSSCAMHV